MIITKRLGISLAIIGCLRLSISVVLAGPEVIYTNGNVITVDDQFSMVTGFAIEGDRFVAVGDSERITALADDKSTIVDLKGKTVIPGLIDNHNHFIRGASHWGNALRLDGVDTRKEALRRLRRHANRLSNGEWLLVLGGWNETQFADDPRGFTREELDGIAADRPAFIQAQYSHAFVNSAFLKRVGVRVQATHEDERVPSNATVDALFGPPLSQLVERDENGTATSRINGKMGMVLQVSTILPAVSEDAALAGVRSAQRHYNSLGLTAIYDPAGALATQQAIDVVEELHSRDDLTVRVFRTVALSTLDSAAISRVLQLRSLPDWLSKFIIGLFNDVESTSASIDIVETLPPLLTGSDFYDNVAIGEVLYVPMHDSADSQDLHKSISSHHREEVTKLLQALLQRGLAAQIHAVHESTLGAYLDILEKLSKHYTIYPNQITFTHAEGVNRKLLSRIQSLGISLQIRSMSMMAAAENEVSIVPPLRDIQDSGVAWGLGTDGTKASQIEPMRTLYWAVSGRAINGRQILREDQRLSREEALIAHTRSNALLVNRANSLGQIRPGFQADFVVLDRDYLSVDIDEIPNIGVEMTVVGGRPVYQKGQD
ncbi:amidohydrolase family protein [Pseudomaricurvus alkylphenolicus]|jgi:predicted amidohydrolase YtcJ|uniref:amidohydrolase n=1 Tax=Pseudomaricurvus alkylphenolicus TaxID=1306991 RepID=UPI0014215A0E|nr:amidohydrolase family protein [Pseudomaricurvus alkylphenolicus]NIB38695.1 amidohydrolase family protein [Pseudomaricurvus alkylphenolicus]